MESLDYDNPQSEIQSEREEVAQELLAGVLALLGMELRPPNISAPGN